jgi:hypothetical protein
MSLWLGELSNLSSLYAHRRHPDFKRKTADHAMQGVLNQEELINELSKALCYIADTLPHVELKAVLFPTPLMKTLVATLYAHIINFVQRAIKWYKEGKIKHAITSITRPLSLRFQDLVDEIRESSRKVDQLAASLSLAEQRRMHSKLQDTYALLEDMKRLMECKSPRQYPLAYSPSPNNTSLQHPQPRPPPRHKPPCLRNPILPNSLLHPCLPLRSTRTHPTILYLDAQPSPTTR